MERITLIVFLLLSVGFFTIQATNSSSESQAQPQQASQLTANFIRAMDKGDIQQAKQLLDTGANANHILATGESLLHRAISMNNRSLTQILLEHKASPLITNAHNETAYSTALHYNNPEIIALLKAH